MSHRIGFLSAVGLVCGGLVAGWISTHSISAQVPVVKPVQTTSPAVMAAPTAKDSPAPPEHRSEGIFDFSVTNKSEQKVLSSLEDPVAIEFIDTPMKDFADFIADQHDITIIIDEHSLTQEGVAIDEPINRTLSGIKLRSALGIILHPMGLDFVVEDEVLKITTQANANARHFTKVYNTGYLKQIGVEPEALSKTIQSVIQPYEWKGQFPRSGLAETASEQTIVSRDEAGKIRVWDAKTGKQIVGASLQKVQAGRQPNESPFPLDDFSSIEVLGDMLVVSAPQSVHHEIQGLLVQLDRRWAGDHEKK